MNVFGLLEFFGQIGARYSRQDLSQITNYLQNMAIDGRIIMVSKHGNPHTFIAYSICNNSDRFANKGLWEYEPHTRSGYVCFIEKMATKRWTRDIRVQLEERILERYPDVKIAVWYRPDPSGDRKVIVKVNWRKYETAV